ncbi:MAG: formate hydrogenase, partial [Leptospira sp.]|nr:formate hydrogenase [Leptospira sp.]
MQLNILYLIGISAFFLVFLSFLLSPTKNQSRVGLWLGLMTLFFAVLISSWEVDDLALRWVLIEASTLIGALLVSLPRTRKALEVAWKFLLINSFGLGIAFLGIIIVSFGVHTQVTLSSKVLLEQVASHQNVFVELGLWLAIFGYSAKLGLFPNHFWVSDTYAESPSQVSAIIAAFVPVSVCLALRPLVRMDQLLTPHIFSAANGFLLLGMMTMIYSLWTLYQTHDIRRISAQIGLFHSGTLAVFLWYDPSDEILYFALGTTILVKSFLFTTMGILRMDSGTRTIDRILIMEGLNRVSSILYIG